MYTYKQSPITMYTYKCLTQMLISKIYNSFMYTQNYYKKILLILFIVYQNEQEEHRF